MNTHDAWERIHSTKVWGGYPSEHVIRFIARNYYMRNRAEVKILDFGCGTGANTWFLAQEGFDTYAFDISESAIRQLDERMKAFSLSCHSLVADGLQLPYKDNYFDAIIDSASIQSNLLADIKAMYKKCHDILVVGGKIMTVVFSKKTTGYGTGIKIESGSYEGITTGPLQHLGVRHFFDEQELEQCLAEAGFQKIRIETAEYTDNGNMISQIIGFGEK